MNWIYDSKVPTKFDSIDFLLVMGYVDDGYKFYQLATIESKYDTHQLGVQHEWIWQLTSSAFDKRFEQGKIKIVAYAELKDCNDVLKLNKQV